MAVAIPLNAAGADEIAARCARMAAGGVHGVRNGFFRTPSAIAIHVPPADTELIGDVNAILPFRGRTKRSKTP